MSSYLHRQDFSLGPISFDEIEKNLYLGSLAAAKDINTLKKIKVTHILTIDTCPLPRSILELNYIKIKYIQLSDLPKEDLLSHFDDADAFIQEGIIKGAVLVHCYFGVSRSAAVVIAHVMKKYDLSYSEAFKKVKAKRSIVFPNQDFFEEPSKENSFLPYERPLNILDPEQFSSKDCIQSDIQEIVVTPTKSTKTQVFSTPKTRKGFITQLNLYKEMGYSINLSNMKYKIYRLKKAALIVKNVKILPLEFMNLIQPDPGLPQSQPDPNVYRCKKCRRVLASESNLILHEDKGKRCIRTFFIEPISWMNASQNIQGKLHCPKCDHKVGSFSWIMGCQCPCGVQVAPAFYLVPSKVDYTNVVKNVEMTF